MDATATVDLFMTRITDGHMGRSIVDLLNSAPPGTASAFYACTAEWANARADAIAAFRASLDETGRFIVEHPDQAKGILATYTKLPVAAVEQTPLPNFQFKASPAQIRY